MIEIVRTPRTPALPVQKILRLGREILEGEGMRRAGDISIVFLNDRRIRTINRRYLHHDCATDVITFPLHETPSPTVEGEIYISHERARIQARRFNVTFENEILRLVAHGLLHLLGYTDTSKSNQQRMLLVGDRYVEAIC